MEKNIFVRHFCRGTMMGIGIAPLLITVLQTPLHSYGLFFIYLLGIMLLCGVIGCLIIPSIKTLAIYYWIERPLMNTFVQGNEHPAVLLADALRLIALAREVEYIDKAQHNQLKHKLTLQSKKQVNHIFSAR